MGVSFVAQTMLLLAVPLRALELGAGPAAVGGLLSAPFWLPMLLAIPLGRLVSRVGAKRTMVAGAVGFTLAPWIAVAWGGAAGLLGTQLLIGLMQISMGLSSQALIATLGGGKSLERNFGWYTTCVSVGQLLGPLTGGLVIDRFGSAAVFPIVGTVPVLSLAAALLVSSTAAAGTMDTSSASSGAPARRTRGLGYGKQLALLRANPAVQLSIVVTVAMMFAIGAHSAFFPVYLESLATPASVIGILLSLRALCSTAVRPFMARAITVLGGRFRTVTTCLFLVAMGLMLTGAVSSWALLGLFAALIGLGTGLAQPLTMVTIADHVPAADRPPALGMRLTVNQAAQVTSPLLLGFVAEFAGFTVMFLVGGLVLLALVGLQRRLGPGYARITGTSAG